MAPLLDTWGHSVLPWPQLHGLDGGLVVALGTTLVATLLNHLFGGFRTTLPFYSFSIAGYSCLIAGGMCSRQTLARPSGRIADQRRQAEVQSCEAKAKPPLSCLDGYPGARVVASSLGGTTMHPET